MKTTSKKLSSSCSPKRFVQCPHIVSAVEFVLVQEGVVAEAACSLLANMCQLNSSRQLIGQEGGVLELIKHLAKGTNSEKAAAVQCLACLFQDSPSNCK